MSLLPGDKGRLLSVSCPQCHAPGASLLWLCFTWCIGSRSKVSSKGSLLLDFLSSGSGGRAQQLLVPGLLSRIGKVQPCSSKHLGFSVSRNTRQLKAALGVVWLCEQYRGEQWWSLHWCHLGLENCTRHKGVKGVTQHWFSWLSGAAGSNCLIAEVCCYLNVSKLPMDWADTLLLQCKHDLRAD